MNTGFKMHYQNSGTLHIQQTNIRQRWTPSMMVFCGKEEFYNFVPFPWVLDKIPIVSWYMTHSFLAYILQSINKSTIVYWHMSCSPLTGVLQSVARSIVSLTCHHNSGDFGGIVAAFFNKISK